MELLVKLWITSLVIVGLTFFLSITISIVVFGRNSPDILNAIVMSSGAITIFMLMVLIAGAALHELWFA